VSNHREATTGGRQSLINLKLEYYEIILKNKRLFKNTEIDN
jgi:hypothetical protein